MKNYIIPVLTVLALATLPAAAQDIYTQTYTGTGFADGGLGDGAGISSVVVGNDASGDIDFTINSTQPMDAYINYAIEIQQIGAPTGYTGFAPPWGLSIGISSGINALINTWTGASGATAFIYSGGWNGGAGGSYTAGGLGNTYATFTTTLSSLGLSPGSSFYFDVISSFDSNPGGQSAYSALDNLNGYPAESDSSWSPWKGGGANYYDSVPGVSNGGNSDFGSAATEYTVASAVPEPTTCVLMGMGALAMIRRSLKQIKK
jgi:hypothetical protein